MYYFILNPVAGGGKLTRIHNKLKQRLSSLNLIGEFMKTSGEGDGESLARLAVKKGYSTIICVGGDSTVSEVLNGVVGSDVTIGIIPIGHNNIFAKKMGIPTNWKDAISVIQARFKDSFDVGKIIESRQYFFLSAGFGAETSLCFKNGSSSAFSMNYDRTVFKSALENQSNIKMRFIVDKSYAITLNVLSASIMNLGFIKNCFLNNFKFDTKDGLLDLVVVSEIKDDFDIPQLLRISKPSDSRLITRIQGREIHVESFSEQLKIHVDGRIITKTPATFKIAPTKQKLIIKKS